MSLGRLHVITDTRLGRDPLPVVAAALEAGAPVVQVRGKGHTDRALYELTCRVLDLSTRHEATCLVNDRVDIALAAGAGGVHLGEHDLPVAAARMVLGEDLLLGGTARDAATARALERNGASYLGVGPCYETSTKSGLPASLGPVRMGEVAAAVDLPVIAIGGVTAALVPELLDAGAWGVAVVGAISEADDPHAATEDLLRAVERAS